VSCAQNGRQKNQCAIAVSRTRHAPHDRGLCAVRWHNLSRVRDACSWQTCVIHANAPSHVAIRSAVVFSKTRAGGLPAGVDRRRYRQSTLECALRIPRWSNVIQSSQIPTSPLACVRRELVARGRRPDIDAADRNRRVIPRWSCAPPHVAKSLALCAVYIAGRAHRACEDLPSAACATTLKPGGSYHPLRVALVFSSAGRQVALRGAKSARQTSAIGQCVSIEQTIAVATDDLDPNSKIPC